MDKELKTHNSKNIKDFLKLGGNLRDSEIARVVASKHSTKENVLDIVENYYTLLVSTNYLREEVYSFYVEDLTYQEIIEKYDINRNYLRTLIYNETNRLYSDLGGYDIYHLLITNQFNELTIKIVTTILNKLLNERVDIVYRENVINVGRGKVDEKDEVFLDNLVSIQPKEIVYDRSFFSTIKDNNFNHLINVIKNLTKSNQQQYIDKINPKFMGYLNYLYYSPESNLAEIDILRKKMLYKVLRIE